MMSETTRSCCEPFVKEHGWPRDFVRAIFPCPAEELIPFLDQLDQLHLKLQELEVCEHFRFHVFAQHSYICNNDFDNRMWRAEVGNALYCQIDPREYARFTRLPQD